MTEAQDTPAPLLKEIFDRARLRHLAEETSAASAFDAERFLALAGHWRAPRTCRLGSEPKLSPSQNSERRERRTR